MASERLARWRKTLWVVLASLLVHAVIVSLFLLPPAVKQPEPAKEDSVSVELVPPPEEPKPPEPKPDAAKPPEPLKLPDPPKPPEPEKPADPPKAEQPPAPPEPPPAPPPPPPPPPAEKPPEEKPTPPPPEKAPEEKPTPPPEEKPTPPPPPEKPPEEAPKDAPPKPEQSKIRALDPVFQYGDKDAGPKKSEDGNSADGDSKPVTPDDTAKPDADDAAKPNASDAAKPDPAEAATPPDVPPADQPPAAAPPSDAPPPDKPPVDVPAGAGLLPPDIDLPQADVPDSIAEKNGPPSDSPDSAKVDLAPALLSDLAKAKPAPPKPAAKPAKEGTLTKAKTLFSHSETGGAQATTAIGNVPRGVRAGELCATELREQLRHAAPVYRPELLPAYKLPSGTVLDVPHSQFRADGQWYNLSFRCEIDANATKVQSFAFDIGQAVPRSEWRSRGFPEN